MSTIPYVGMPATYSIGSDEYGGKVIAVSKTAHRLTFQNESGRIVKECSRRRDGSYMVIGSSHGFITLGVSETKIDEGF